MAVFLCNYSLFKNNNYYVVKKIKSYFFLLIFYKSYVDIYIKNMIQK